MNHLKRIPGYSLLRVLACIAIIILHMFASAEILFQNVITPEQITGSNIIVNCMMWAVPCFVMVTGALLLDENREVSFDKLFNKYILRALGALVVFSMVFRIFDIIMDKESFGLKSILKGFYEIFTGTGWSHIWYLYLLIGLYLLLPFYKKIAKASSNSELKYLLVIYLIFLSLIPLTQLAGIQSKFYIHVSTIYPFYLFCGYAIANESIRLSKVKAVLLIIVGTAGIIAATVCKGQYNVEQLELLWGYSSILVVCQAAGIFYLMKNVKIQMESKRWKCINFIDQCSFGIYILHMIVVRLVLRYWGFNPYEGNIVLNFGGLIIGTLCVTLIVIAALRKIPGMKKIL